jgi:D-inositol-3-phosphate glycosyltransferase
MRIALVTSYMPPHLGGIETIGQHLYDGYRASGHEVRWMTSRVPSSLPTREGGIQRTPCMNVTEDWLGIPVPIWGPGALRELRELVRWSEVVHVLECLYLSSAAAVGAARLGGRPVVVSQNVGFIPYESAWVRGIEHLAYQTLGRAVLRGASHVVLATPAAEGWIREMYGGRIPDWASCVPVGIDTGQMRPAEPSERALARTSLGLSEDRPVVLFAGRLVEKKGLPLVLKAATLAPDLDFLVAGDGPLRGALRAPPANVRWLGTVDAGLMRKLYACADAALLPSRGEGLPLVVQEAMSCGLPVVISADEVYAASLRDARACVVSERVPLELVAALRTALVEKDSIGPLARAHAVENWERGKMIRCYEALLESLRRPA